MNKGNKLAHHTYTSELPFVTESVYSQLSRVKAAVPRVPSGRVLEADVSLSLILMPLGLTPIFIIHEG